MSNELSIVMYHYVRDLERSRYPKIKGRKESEFRAQLAFFKKEMNPVSMAEVVHAVKTGDALPPKAVLLTFDDGYSDHYQTCFPLLFDAKMSGAFFPPVAPVQDKKLLDVNRIHFLLAVADTTRLAMELDQAIDASDPLLKLKTTAEYCAEWAKPNRFDDAETIYIKRMLQMVLPEDFRNTVAQRLFAKYVTQDEAAFASELYCTPDQLRVMQASGMYVGSHGTSHYWLNAVAEDVQSAEVETSLQFLRDIGSPVDDYWVMCYPYGGWNESLLATLRNYRCTLGLTTAVATARLDSDNPLLLPRHDTNDFIVW